MAKKVKLLPWEVHQLRIARRTLRMPDPIADVLGIGKKEARRIITQFKLVGKL